MKSRRGRGGVLEKIVYRNISLQGITHEGIMVDMMYPPCWILYWELASFAKNEVSSDATVYTSRRYKSLTDSTAELISRIE